MGEFLDIYEGGRSFREQLARDFDDGAVWFNLGEFARFHDIDGKRVLSVVAGDRRGQTGGTLIGIKNNSNENSEGVVKSRGVLFVRADEIEGVRATQALRLDGRLYTVVEARILQDRVWRIMLEANES